MSIVYRLRRLHCRLFHGKIAFAGGKQYQCRTCLLLSDNPWHKESELPRPVSVRQVAAPKKRTAKVRRMTA